MALAGGVRIGPYQITAPLGAGGMGEVYRARDSKLNRDVALKVLAASFAEDGDYLARFHREAQVLASLSHPNIAAIYGIEGSAIVMELVEGPTLAERIAQGPMPLKEALEIAKQIAGALEAAHEKGVTHRDLKPANIKVTPQGVVKVLDFGLAKLAEPAAASSATANSPTLTIHSSRVGMIMGTAAYMPPEQARGQAVDKRADIWAFGVVLWELLTGRQLFEGDTVSDVLAGVLKNEPDLQAVPLAVRHLLFRCLEKDPRKRLRDIGDWSELLRETPAPAQSRSSRGAWAAAGLLGVAAALALWAPWRNSGSPGARPMLHADLDLGGRFSEPAISRDGLRVVYVADGQIFLRRLDDGSTRVLPGTSGASLPFFSPDAQWIGFFAGGKLRKISIDGGSPISLCDAPSGRGASWGDDDQIVAALNSADGLNKISAAGGTPQRLTEIHADSDRWPHVLPHGKGVIFTSVTEKNSDLSGALIFLPPSGGKEIVLAERAAWGRFIEPGFLVFYQGGRLLWAPVDSRTMEPTAKPAVLLEGIDYDARTGVPFDAAPNGALIFERSVQPPKALGWLDRTGRFEQLPLKPGLYLTPRISPDGSRLAVAIRVGNEQNLWIYDIPRDNLTRLTFDPEAQTMPVWSPDSAYLAFRTGGELGWFPTGKTGSLQRLKSRLASPGSFSPDGKWLSFGQNDRVTAADLWSASVSVSDETMKLTDPQPILQLPGTQALGVISPDGKWIAYMSNESGGFEVYVTGFTPRGPLHGARWKVSNAGGQAPIWSRRSNELVYLGPDSHVMVSSYSVKSGLFTPERPRLWADRPVAIAGPFPNYDLAPDGQRVIGLFDLEPPKPETHLRVLLNVSDELTRRGRRPEESK